MLVKTGQAVTTEFTTATPTTGAAANADSLPTATLYVDGTANGASVTVTNVTTGIYKAAVTLPTLTAGQVVSIVVSATVATVAGTGKVWEAVADTLRVSDTLTANPASGGIASASFAGGATIPRVTLADTVTTYTGNTPQTGDAYARIGAAGAGLTAVATAAALVTAQADLTTLTGRLTSARAGYLDALAGFTGTVRQALRALAAKAAGETSADLTGGTSTYDNATDSQEAAIDNATGATPATFWTYAGGRTLTSNALVTFTGPVLTSGDVVVVQGDDYSATDGRSLSWTYTDATATYTAATATVDIYSASDSAQWTAAVSKSGSTVTVTAEPTAAQTAALNTGVYDFQIHIALQSGRNLTPIKGSITVVTRLSGA